MDLLKNVGEELLHDPQFAPLILAPIEVLGVDSFGASQITIKTRIKTLPQEQWKVGRELRRRIKITFDNNNIEMPLSAHERLLRRTSKPFDVSSTIARNMAIERGKVFC